MTNRTKIALVALIAAVLGAPPPLLAAQVPANDFFAFANVANALPYVDSGVNTMLASTEPNEPLDGCPQGAGREHTVWYKLVAPATTTVSAAMTPANVTSNNMQAVSVLAYEGTDLLALTQLRCERSYWTRNAPVHVAFPVTVGHTYYIQVGNWASDPGIFTFTLQQQVPANDFFAFANVANALPYVDSGVNTMLASTEPNEPLDGCPQGAGREHTVWYKLVAPATTTVSAAMTPANVTSNNMQAVSVLAYEGTDLLALTQLRCERSYWTRNAPVHVAFPVTVGHTYYIQVGNWASDPGIFTFTLTTPRSTVSLYASSTSVRQGSSVILTGSVRPSYPGGVVTIQRKLGGTWRTFATVRLSSASAYRYVFVPKVAGAFVLRAIVAARTNPDLLKGTSTTRTITVR